MNVEALGGDDRRGAGGGVFLVDLADERGVWAEGFDVPEDLAGAGVDAEGAEGEG
jgi:hypothetical protein